MLHERRSPKREPWTPDSERGYTAAAILVARPSSRQVLRQFADWLKRRELGQGSITVRTTSARVFIDWVTRGSQSASRGFRKLVPDDVERFFVVYGKDHGPGARRSMQAAMRLVLRYTAERGWTPVDLVRAVPSIRSYRLSDVPQGLDDQEVTRLLSSLDGASARDRAVLFLLATYGARRQQVSALRLQDIDWQARKLTFTAHKGGKAVTHVLTPLVAESLATYLRDGRAAVDTDAVFLREFPPHLRVSPASVTDIVYRVMARAGLPARGPHTLRHAFATRLLAAGQSVKAIADLLGIGHSAAWPSTPRWTMPDCWKSPASGRGWCRDLGCLYELARAVPVRVRGRQARRRIRLPIRGGGAAAVRPACASRDEVTPVAIGPAGLHGSKGPSRSAEPGQCGVGHLASA